MTDLHLSNNSFETRLHRACDEVDLPVRGRARALNSLLGSELSDKAVKKWLDGESFPTVINVQKLCAVLNASPTYLVFGEKEANPLINSIIEKLTKKPQHLTDDKLSVLLAIINTWD